MLRTLSILVSLGVVVAAAVAAWAWYDYRTHIDAPIATDEPVVFTVQRGWSARRVADELAAAGLLERPHWLYLEARLTQRDASLRSGEYVLQPGTRTGDLLDQFAQGQTVQYGHTIIEGATFREVIDRLANAERLERTIPPAEVGTAARGEAVMQAIGHPELHPEGQFFADTYRFPADTTDVEFLARAKRELDRVLDEEWQQRADGLPLQSPYEALILASIVEKETAVAEERPLIAGVFISRLNRGMRLQTDPTVIYGIGESFDGDIRRRDLTTDTPYNTYTRAGLPPTPIAMVGREAIHAALNPQSTTALYFVSKGDGTHQFSETLEQHEAAVRKYQLGQ